jgi:hypothetical protein
MVGAADSLNLAMAGSLFLCEVYRAGNRDGLDPQRNCGADRFFGSKPSRTSVSATTRSAAQRYPAVIGTRAIQLLWSAVRSEYLCRRWRDFMSNAFSPLR